jgi:Na+/proline symporter
LPAKGDDVFPFLAMQFSPVVGVLFIVGLISAAYAAAGSALTALTTSFTVDILESPKTKTENQVAAVRKKVHIGMAVVMAVVIFIINLLNNDSVINTVYMVASYTYGPLLGMFAFGMFTKKAVKDKWAPLVAIVSPVLCFILDVNSQAWFNGYQFSHERLILNAFFTFVGLCLLIRKK